MVGIAATGLVAAAVATVLATSSGSGSTAAGGPSAGSSALSAPTGAVKVQDTAYIVKRVKATIADEGQSSIVIHTDRYASGDVSADGSLTLGPQNGEGWDYEAQDGTFYQRNVGVNADRSVSPMPESLQFTVYVDAQTYQPLRTVTINTSPTNSTASVADWIPARPDSIAEAKDDSDPSGYTQVYHLDG
jgi:hypothetical protein